MKIDIYIKREIEKDRERFPVSEMFEIMLKKYFNEIGIEVDFRDKPLNTTNYIRI